VGLRSEEETMGLCRIVLIALFTAAAAAGEPAAPNSYVTGWRGDGTGCYPNATPPLEWYRLSKTVRGLSCQARRPKDPAGKDGAVSCADGFISQWMVLAPVDAADPKTAFEQEVIPKEAEVQPDEGEKAGTAAWKTVAVEDSLLNVLSVCKEMSGKIAYAHTYIHSQTGGKLMLQVNHAAAMKLWLNGKVAYTKPERYVYNDGRIPVQLAVGWNRLLIKLTPFPATVESGATCFVRLRFWSGDPADTYESKNILWSSPMPNRCASSPIVVGERMFLGSAPYDLVCVSKKDGKILWVKSNNYSDAAGAEEKQAHADIFKKIEPLAARRDEINQACASATFPLDKVLEEKDFLDAEIDKLMAEVDKAKYKRPPQDAGFYSAATPCSDGNFVYDWFAQGVTVCYTLDGNRKWIHCDNRHGNNEHGNWASPLLVAGKVVTCMKDIVALDAATGEQVWKYEVKHGEWYNGCALARIGTTDVIVANNGAVLRATDGMELVKGSGWHWTTTPVVYEGRALMVTPENGGQFVFNLPATADKPAPAALVSYSGAVPKELLDPGFPDFLARYGTASQLCHDSLSYTVCAAGILTVMDLKQSAQDKASIVYQKLLPADSWGLCQPYPYTCGVCASPTLAGKHIFVEGSAGTTLVFDPGRQFKLVVRNKIECPIRCDRKSPWNYLFNYWPEHLEGTVSNPVFEGSRLYLRAERNLYCIGEK
jgi:outer membrane protein assembly factor BamB